MKTDFLFPVFITCFFLALFLIMSPGYAQDSGPSGSNLLVRQQIKTQQIEDELRDLRGSMSDDMQDVRARLSDISSRLDDQTGDDKQSIQKMLSSIASLEDTISLLEQRMRRTIEMSSDLDFRIIRLENKIQTLLNLSSENSSSAILDSPKTPIQSRELDDPINQSNVAASEGSSWLIGQQLLDEKLQQVTEEAFPTANSVEAISDAKDPLTAEFDKNSNIIGSSDNVSEKILDVESISNEMELEEYNLPEGTIEEQYQFAVQLALSKNLDEAARAFERINALYPDEPRAADALFFLGRVQYMQKQFELAAYSFSEFNMNYPNDSRLVDSTLFLAKSVGEFAAAEQACPIFESLPELLEEKPQKFLAEMQILSEKKQCKNQS